MIYTIPSTPIWPTPRVREWAKPIISRFARVIPAPLYVAEVKQRTSKIVRHREGVQIRMGLYSSRTNDGRKQQRLEDERMFFGAGNSRSGLGTTSSHMRAANMTSESPTAQRGPHCVQRLVRRCGHCGAKPRIVGRKADGYYVACLARDCRQPATCCHKTRQGAIDEWNEETV